MKSNERKVLRELLEDGRKKITKIADNIGISRQTVSKKIEELKEKNIIKSFIANVNPRKVGLDSKAYMILDLVPSSERRHDFVLKVKDFEEVSQIHYTFGRFDMIIEILVEDDRELDNLVNRIHEFEAVEETETLICRYTEKEDRNDPFRKVLSEG